MQKTNFNHGTVMFILLGFMVPALFGCPAMPEKPLRMEDMGTVFQFPVNEVRRAAAEAVLELGMAIQQETQTYVQARMDREKTMGGEIVGIWLEPLDANRTKVLIDTATSGLRHQRDWKDQILGHMINILNQ